MQEHFPFTVKYGDRPWEGVGGITIVSEKLLAMLEDPTVRFELARNIKHNDDGTHTVMGVFLAPVQLAPPSKAVCGDMYHHEDDHVYYCGLKPKHGGLHDSLVDEFDLYDGESVTWLDAARRVEG